MVSVLGRRGQGAPILLDESCDSSDSNGYAVRLIWPEAVKLQLARRAVSGFSCSTGAEGALGTWNGVREDERRPADPVDDFRNGARAGGSKVSTGEDFLPVDLLVAGKGDEVASPVDPFLDRKNGGAATVIARKRQVELQPRFRGFGGGLPDLKPTSTSWSGGEGGGHSP